MNQITVKDIVLECGVNRNSFYYYFEDLPTLPEEVLKSDADRPPRFPPFSGGLSVGRSSTLPSDIAAPSCTPATPPTAPSMSGI